MSQTSNPINPRSPSGSPTRDPSPILTVAKAESFEVPRPARRGFRWFRIVLALLIVVAGGFGVRWIWPAGEELSILTVAVRRDTLPIIVIERGELESSHTVDARCEVEGYQNKIVSIIPEGTRAKKGDLVVTFDSDALARQYADQEVKYRTAEGKAKSAKGDLEVAKNKAEGEVAKAARDLELAGLDRDKYPAEYKADYEEKRGDIEIAKKDLHEAKEKLEHTRSQVKKGYEAPEQLRTKELDVARYEYNLLSKEARLLVLEKWTRRKTEAELTGKAEDAARELDRAKKSGAAAVEKAQTELDAAVVMARLEKTTLDRFKRQLDRCQIHAPEDGILVYSHERYWDPSMQIQPGAMCHFQQIVFKLPDLAKMQVKVNIHEAVVKKIKLGQPAEIRVDALPNIQLKGTVKTVATLAQNEGFWNRSGVKEYETVIAVDQLPADAGLKPGMTAEVRIDVAQIADVLIVPVQAVSEREGKHCAYVRSPKGIERRDVSVGENNEKFIEIKSGLTENELVTLDARSRVAAEAKANEGKSNLGKAKKPEATPAGTTTTAPSRPVTMTAPVAPGAH